MKEMSAIERGGKKERINKASVIERAMGAKVAWHWSLT